MSDRLDGELKNVIVDSFSMLGFMFPLDVSPQGDVRPQFADDAVTVEVTFRGPVEGVMRLRTERQLVAALAANMIGADEPPPFEQQVDALKEMLNVICGNMLPAIDAQSVFDVHAPQAGQWVEPRESAGDDAARALVALDGGCVEVSMNLSAAVAL